MPEHAIQSLLPGAPEPTSERVPLGVFALDLAMSRLGLVPVEVDLVGSAAECPEALLPWLAWGVSIEAWSPEWSAEQKRLAIDSNRLTHQRKGTKQAVLDVLADAGFPAAQIREGIGWIRRDGTHDRRATINHDSGQHWAYYSVLLPAGTEGLSLATRELIERVAPARCRLFAVEVIEGEEPLWTYQS